METAARRSTHLERVMVGQPDATECELVDPGRADQFVVIADIVPANIITWPMITSSAGKCVVMCVVMCCV